MRVSAESLVGRLKQSRGRVAPILDIMTSVKSLEPLSQETTNMPPDKSLKDTIFFHLSRYGFLISAAGIRYGSIVYVAFGKAVLKRHRGRASTTQYPVELEIGSDNWELVQDEACLIDSDFENVDNTREKLQALLVGHRIIDIDLIGEESRIFFDGGLILCSRIASDPASGFLYSFQVENGFAWETIDGVSMQA